MGKGLGKIHKMVVDPLGILPEKVRDPLNLFGKKNADAAAAPAPAVMPDADSEAVAAARRRRIAAMKVRGGRDSTVLGGEDRLGG